MKCLLGAFLCALALAGAFTAEWGFHLAPCALCLVQRWPYRIGIALGLAGALLPARFQGVAVWVMALVFVSAAAAASVHVGVELHWWKSPLPQCTAPDLSGLSVTERFARMPLRPSASCEDPTYILGPVTMAQANLAYALAGMAAMTMLARRNRSALA